MSWRNDLVRRAAIRLVPLAASWFDREIERRIDRFESDQDRLRAEYAITPTTPIRGYDSVTKKSVERYLEGRPDARVAKTSGSTSEPKVLAYPPERLSSFRWDSRSVGLRAWAKFRIEQPSIFVLSSLANDDSFTSLAVYQEREPALLTGLIEPARYLFSPALKDRIERYGATAVRLWLIALSDPGVVYSTNPSTLAVFLSEIYDDWDRSTELIRDWVAGRRSARDAHTVRIAGRVKTSKAELRLSAIASAESPLPMSEIAPGLSVYCCWDGGYVVSFLRQIHRWLPPHRYTHVPMYAMSTETIETLTWFGDRNEIRFLPLGPGVLYEFLPEGAEDDPEALLRASELEAGRSYTMIVSDPYGLVRYQTEDLFLCRGHVRGVPDLRFERRRGLAWSFTGEKLTAEQLSEAYQRLEEDLLALKELGAQLTTLPSWPEGQPLPRYRLVVAHPGKSMPEPPDERAIGRSYDQVLRTLNEEYASKRDTGRLAAPDVSVLPYDRIARALSSAASSSDTSERRAWDSQFKLTPLVCRRWEELSVP